MESSGPLSVAYHVADYGACLWISSSVEVNIGIIFTCMHAMRPVLAKLVPEFFTSGSGGSSNKYSNEKSASNKSAASNKPKPRLNPFAAVSGVGKWITRMDDTKATTSSDNGDSTDSVELSPGLEGGYGAGTGKAKTRVTTGSVPADAPSDSIVYAQEVEVFAGRKA